MAVSAKSLDRGRPMFGAAYVILPFSDVVPADAIAASLARFERGRKGVATARGGRIAAGSVPDDCRWIANWPSISPPDAIERLGLPTDAPWRDVLLAVYHRFNDHRAAGVAFHH